MTSAAALDRPARSVLPSLHPSHDGIAGPASLHEPARTVLDHLQSALLLQGHNSVGIEHNGTLYRLHATKLGKLILTK